MQSGLLHNISQSGGSGPSRVSVVRAMQRLEQYVQSSWFVFNPLFRVVCVEIWTSLICLWNGTFCVPAGSAPPCWDRKQMWNPKRTQSPEAFHRCVNWLQCWNLPNHFYGNNFSQFFSDPFLLLEKAISETLPKRFPYGRVLFPWLLHCFSPTCTCIHVRRDCLEVGINNEGYFGYPRFERKHGFHPVWAFQFSLACCLFLCRPLRAFAGFLLLWCLTDTDGRSVSFLHASFGRTTKRWCFSQRKNVTNLQMWSSVSLSEKPLLGFHLFCTQSLFRSNQEHWAQYFHFALGAFRGLWKGLEKQFLNNWSRSHLVWDNWLFCMDICPLAQGTISLRLTNSDTRLFCSARWSWLSCISCSFLGSGMYVPTRSGS